MAFENMTQPLLKILKGFLRDPVDVEKKLKKINIKNCIWQRQAIKFREELVKNIFNLTIT